MKFLASFTIILSISFTALPGLVSAGDGGQYSGVTNCFIGGRWVTVRGNCPAPSGGGGISSGGAGSSSGGGAGTASSLQGGFYSLGYAFGQWLAGGGSGPQDEARRRAMMEELQRRQAEAERQQREEEARRLAGIYNRLSRTLKLSGTPEMQLKGSAGSGQGLKLKIGDSAGGRAGITGLPGIYLDGGDKPYGVPGLPGIYTGGPGQESGLSASGLKLKINEESAAAAPTANVAPAPAVQTVLFNPADMTPQQLADIAEMVGRLPPEEQARLMTMAQKDSAVGTPVPGTAAPTIPGVSGQLPSTAPASLSQQVAASRSAASPPTLEDASDKARAGFDRPFDASPVQPGKTTRMPTALTPSSRRPSDPTTINPPPAAGKPIPEPPPKLSADASALTRQATHEGIDADTAATASYETWTRDQKRLIEDRLQTSNKYARDLYDSLTTGAPPPLPPTGFSTLKPGDVILLAPDDSMLSHLIRRGDNISSLENSSASHTIVFLKEVNGTKLFLDHTMEMGTRVITGKEFFKEYGGRDAFKASSNWLAQPVRADEAARIWEAAKELAKKEADGRNRKSGNIVDQTGYGLYGDDNMVCSEAARWVLVKAGRDIPETSSPIKRLLGIHYGPANFFADQHSFIITPLYVTGDANR